ncbi:hypothetical protein MJN51_34005, partial [Salmonella enterica subsp. enterica serovar Kentucky]|nr:hypothetical protein [Salmonella enterica subsp. enterica serovar Kentucky]
GLQLLINNHLSGNDERWGDRDALRRILLLLIQYAVTTTAMGKCVVRSIRKKFPQAQVSRVAGADLWEALMARAGKEGTPVFLVGG